MTAEETAENIIACWENSDKKYAHLQTLIVRGIKHHRQAVTAVRDLEIEGLDNEVEYYKDLKLKEQTEFKTELDKLKEVLDYAINSPDSDSDVLLSVRVMYNEATKK